MLKRAGYPTISASPRFSSLCIGRALNNNVSNRRTETRYRRWPLKSQSEETTSDVADEVQTEDTPPSPKQKPQRLSSIRQVGSVDPEDQKFSWDDFFRGELPKKLAILLALIAFSRLGVYVRLPGVDVDAFAQKMQSGGILGYVDTLSGGSISRVGFFSLGHFFVL